MLYAKIKKLVYTIAMIQNCLRVDGNIVKLSKENTRDIGRLIERQSKLQVHDSDSRFVLAKLCRAVYIAQCHEGLWWLHSPIQCTMPVNAIEIESCTETASIHLSLLLFQKGIRN